MLVELREQGALTVPELARSRGVSRQDIQTRVDRLAEEGLVRPRENPKHRRSRLIELTTRGREEVRRLARREREAYKRLASHLPLAPVRSATRTLAAVRERLEQDPS